MIAAAGDIASKKKLLLLDMWADAGAKSGASKKWLHAELEKGFAIEVVNAGTTRGDKLRCLVESFVPNRKAWGRRYYDLQEKRGKTPALFRTRTRRFQRAVDQLVCPDALLQVGGLFGPVAIPGIPYLTYHDQTVKMVEEGWPEWLPDDFASFREEWYARERHLYRSVSRVVTYSEYTRRSMIDDYGVPAERVVVIPAACKMAAAGADELRRPRRKQLLFATTGFFRKGGDMLLAAFPLIRRAHPDVTLLIAGEKLPPGVTIDDAAIKHAGTLPPEQLRQEMLESTLLVHPARYDAFPNVLKEAMACGLPAVASRRCGIGEIMADGETGVLLEELSPSALAETVIALLDDREKLDSFRENALSRSERFRVEVIGGRFRELVTGLIAGRM